MNIDIDSIILIEINPMTFIVILKIEISILNLMQIIVI